MKMRNEGKSEYAEKIKKTIKDNKKISKLKIAMLLLIIITIRLLIRVRTVMRTREVVIKTITIVIITMT